MDDHQEISLPGAAVSGMSLDDYGSVIAADLGDMLDAIIIEHSGTLDKVITNLRDAMTVPDRLQKLSQDIARVSEAVSAVPESQVAAHPKFARGAGSHGKHSMILDMDSEILRRRTSSVPQLLELIDTAANELGVVLSKPGQYGVHRTPEAVSASAAPVAEEKVSGHSVGRRLNLPGGITPIILTPYGSTLSTALPTPEVSETASYLPAINIAQPLPANLGPFNEGPTTLPSEVLRGKDLTPLPPSEPPGARPALTHGLSRIPLLKSTSKTPPASIATPRAYRSLLARTPSTVLAPYQKSEEKSTRTAALVKPSEVVGKQKMQQQQLQQKTFEQAWLRESSRAISGAERAERRERAASGGERRGVSEVGRGGEESGRVGGKAGNGGNLLGRKDGELAK